MSADEELAALSLTYEELCVMARTYGRRYVRVSRLRANPISASVSALIGKGLLRPRAYTLDDYDTHGLTDQALELLPALLELWKVTRALEERPPAYCVSSELRFRRS